jgi:hypothetical protein
MTPGSVEGRFMLSPIDAQHTDVTARLASDFPPAVASLFHIPAVTRYFEEAVDESLANIEGMAATP